MARVLSPLPDRVRALKWYQSLSFSVGHVLNDLCGSMWYTYALVFLLFVRKLPSVTAGIIMTAGLASDAFFTPIVAYETDHGSVTGCLSTYGKRKSVHLFGSLAVAICFPLLFSDLGDGLEFSTTLAILIVLACVFQFGYASVQISHLSMVPQLTPHNWERDELNIYRYCGDVLSDISVFLITYLVFYATSTDLNFQVDETDGYKLRDVAVIITLVGLVCTVVYHVWTPEDRNWASRPGSPSGRPAEKARLIRATPNLPQGPPPRFLSRKESLESSGSEGTSKSVKDWLRSGSFYQVGLLLLLGRIYNNVNTSFLPLYLAEGLSPASVTYLTIIPLLLNLSGFVFSILIKFIRRFLSKKIFSVLGSLLSVAGCGWLYFGSDESIRNWAIFPLTILMGGGGSVLQVIALNYTSDMIGHNTESASFVYGTVGFAEKLTNGAVILLVQFFRGYCVDCDDYYRHVLGHISSTFALLSLIVVLTLRESALGSSDAGMTRTSSTASITSPVLISKHRLGLDDERNLGPAYQDYGSLTSGFSASGLPYDPTTSL